MADEAMVYDSQGRLVPLATKRKAEQQGVTTTATVQGMPQQQPQQMQQQMQKPKGPSVIERVASFMMPKKKSPQQTAGTLASMQQQGRILRETRTNVRQQDFKRYQQGAKSYSSNVNKYLGGEVKTVYVKNKKTGMLEAKQIRTKGLQQRLSPSRLAKGVRGAKKIEKDISQYRGTVTGVAGMLFPMSGASTQLKSAGYKRGRAGRPAGVYKHVIPGVGPVHVYDYRKWARAQRNKANQAAAMREQMIAQQMMKRGLPPQMAYEQAQQFQQIREQRALEAAQEAMQGYQQPQQQVPQQYQQYPQQMQQMQQPARIQARAPINILGPDRQMQQQAPQGMKQEISFFNSNVRRMVPVNEKSERWASESHPQRPGQIGLRKSNQNQQQGNGGYY